VLEEQFQMISGYEPAEVREGIASLLNSALIQNGNRYILRSSRRHYFENLRYGPDKRNLLLAAQKYYLNLHIPGQGGEFVESEAENLRALFEGLLVMGLPKQAVKLVMKEARWFFERIFERDHEEGLRFLEVVVSTSEQIGEVMDELLLKALLGYFFLRHSSELEAETLEGVVRLSREVDQRARVLMADCQETSIYKQLLWASLGARSNIADYLRHLGKPEEAIEIYKTSLLEVPLLEDELFNDMWTKHIAFALMRINSEPSLIEAITTLHERIDWADCAGEWRRLAAAYHHLGDAKALLADHLTRNQCSEVLLESVDAFQRAIKWDTRMLRPRYLGWDYRDLAKVLYRLSQEQSATNERANYRQQAQVAIREALPRLEKYGYLKEDVIDLAKDLDVDLVGLTRQQ
jgi:hypothetical protein